MAHYYKDGNGVKHRVAGMGLIDRVLSLTSHHAIANDVVTTELNEIKSDLTDMHKLIKSEAYTSTSLAYSVCFNDFYNKVSSIISAFDNATKNRMILTITNSDGSIDVYKLDRTESSTYYFTQITAGSPTTAIRTVKLASSSSFIITLLTTNGVNIVDSSSSAINSTRTFELYI